MSEGVEGEGATVRGNFSLALQQQLQALASGAPIDMADFAARLIDRTQESASRQTPWCVLRGSLFLGGALARPRSPHQIAPDGEGRLWLDAGIAHGVLAGTRLVVASTHTDEGRDAQSQGHDSTGLALIEVTQAGVARSLCTVVEGDAPQLPAPAAIVQPGSARVRVRHAAGAPQLLEGAASPVARLNAVAQSGEQAADFSVREMSGAFWIDDATGTPLSGPFAPAAMDALRVELAHRARYAVALAQRGGVAELPSGSLSLALERLLFDNAGFPHSAPLESSGGEPQLQGGMPVVVRVTNHTAHPLNVALFRFGPACSITSLAPAAGAPSLQLAGGETRTFGCSARPDEQIHAPLPDDALEARLLFRVYGSAAPMAASLLEQGPLEASHLPAQAATSSAPLPPPAPWASDERGLRLLPPQGALALKGALGAHVAQTRALPRIEPPPGFSATLRWLGPTEQVAQQMPLWPPALAAHPHIFRAPASLRGARTGAAGETIVGIEIAASAQSRSLVCAAAPLRLHITAPDDAALLAFAWDGVDAYPVGRAAAGAATLDLTWLPGGGESDASNTSARAANLERTLRIYFCEVRGTPAADVGLFAVRYVPNPWAATASRSRFARSAPGGELLYTNALLAQPNERIALVIHGFADDSAEEAYWLTQLNASGAASHYDRILTFEWESLRTDVRASAERLREAVNALALGEAPGASIDIFAHSMGALVARTYVELLGGAAHVRRCFFTGPPNLGTPLAATALFTPWLLTLALNLPAPTPPSLLIAWALGAVAWDMQGPMAMHPDALLLSELNTTRGAAQLRYHVIAGNAQRATTERVARWRSVLADAMHGASEWFYQGENDWVVSVRSARALPLTNYPGSVLLSAEVDETHLSYYRSQAVTAQVLRWLDAAPESAIS